MEQKTLSFENEFNRRNKGRAQLIRFMREALGKNEVTWDDMTSLNLDRICEYISNKVTPNSARTYFAIIKAFLNRYKDENIMPKNNAKMVLKSKQTPSQNVFLTEEEISRIERYVPESECEMDVKAAFLIECYLGARRSDVKNITEKDIRDGRVVYVSKKTQIQCSVPVHKNLMKYLLYKPKKERALAVYIYAIQKICKSVGINQRVRLFYHGSMKEGPKYEFVGSHTARRSFCTNLARRGADIYTIAALAGHGQNVLMTQRYIVTDTDNLSDAAMDFFNG